MEQSSTDKKILANSLGEQPPKRKKANSDKDRRILSIVQNYHSYEDDVLTYIDLLKSAMWNVYVIAWYYSIRVLTKLIDYIVIYITFKRSL